MNPNRISLGSGLCLLSLAVFGHAAVQWASATHPVASAKGPAPPPVKAEARRTIDDGPQAMTAGVGDGCLPSGGVPSSWFGAIRRVSLCDEYGGVQVPYFMPGEDATYADVDNDGRPERFRSFNDVSILPPSEPCLLAVDEITFDDEVLVVDRSCVLSTQQLADWIQANTEWTQASLTPFQARWSDVDTDGDLDLFLSVSDSFPFGEEIRLWLENTGFEATQLLVGDLDGDGAVGASDLTMLLGGWTGN